MQNNDIPELMTDNELTDAIEQAAGGNTPAAPAYPIYFRKRGTPAEGWPLLGWFWHDPTLEPGDVGPFASRDEAVANWAVADFTNGMAIARAATGEAISALPPVPPSTEQTEGEKRLAFLLRQLDRLDVSLEPMDPTLPILQAAEREAMRNRTVHDSPRHLLDIGRHASELQGLYDYGQSLLDKMQPGDLADAIHQN